MNDVRIRPIIPRDIAELIELGEECGLSPWTAQNYLDELKNPDSLMIRLESSNNLTIGFIVGRRVPAVDNDTDVDAEIYNIAVSPKYRNRGLGDSLLLEFLSNCVENKVRFVWLEVRESNTPAIDFYTHRGFSAISKRRSFYRDPVEDAILMRKSLIAKISLA